jgi:hypothetical protein
LLENDQSELTALEKGKHAWDHLHMAEKAKGGKGKTGGIREYARIHNYSDESLIRKWLDAYRVVLKTADIVRSLKLRRFFAV